MIDSKGRTADVDEEAVDAPSGIRRAEHDLCRHRFWGREQHHSM